MASVEPYQNAAGKTLYMVRYRGPDRKSKKKRGFRSKRAANEWLQDNEVAIRGGKWRPAIAGRITVTQLAREHLEVKRPSLSATTIPAYENSIQHITKYAGLGGIYVKDVTVSTVESWVAELSQDVQPKTVKNSFNFLHAVFERGIRDERIAVNPCKGVQLPKVVGEEPQFLSAGEVRRLIDAAGEVHAPVVEALVKTGMRWGELAGLQVGAVDFERQVIHIRRQLTEVNGTIIDKAPKHDKRRTVPLVDSLLPVMEKKTVGKDGGDLVFTTARGAVLRARNERRAWFDAAVKEIGREGFTPHDLRHTFASLAIKSGANPKALQAMLGHSSITITMDRYSHLYPEDLRAFTAGFDELFS